MDRDTQLSLVLENLYDGRGDPRDWVAALGPICDYVGGEVGQLVIGNHDRSQWGGVYFHELTPNRPPGLVTDFLKTHGGTDPRRPIFLAKEGSPVFDHEIEPKNFDTSAIVREFLDPYELRRQVSGVFVRTDSAIGTLSVMRPRKAGRFGAGHKRRLGIILSHLRQAYHLHKALGERVPPKPAASNVLDLFDVPVFVCGEDRTLHLANAAAIRLIDGGWLRMQLGRLRAPMPDEDAKLGAALLAAGRARSQIEAHLAVITLTLDGPRSERLLPLRVCPLPQHHPLKIEAGERGSVALIGIEARTGGIAPASLLSRLYGLRAAEARLAALLIDGASLADAADHIGITMNTARSYLKLVFERTGVHRQAELIALLRSVVSVPLAFE